MKKGNMFFTKKTGKGLKQTLGLYIGQGDNVKFKFGPSFNVWQFPDEDAYNACDFSRATAQLARLKDGATALKAFLQAAERVSGDAART